MWSIWKFILRRLAKAQGFLDPMAVFANLQHFSKPSEVWVPFELLRSGAVLQARGLINSQAIQNNLDWVWPYWVERQFNPNDKAFIPRAFSLTHINLTHRNWTAVGLPDYIDFPIVDPCGLLTPFFDGWSIDAWIVHDKSIFAPSRQNHVDQHLDLKDTFAVLTSAKSEKVLLNSRVEVTSQDGPVCVMTIDAKAMQQSWLMVCIRPYNPEGVSFIKDIELFQGAQGWKINKKEHVFLDQQPSRYLFANYNSGDLCEKACLKDPKETSSSISCKIGMATSAALYPLEANREARVTVRIPLLKEGSGILGKWSEHMQGACAVKIPDQKMEFLYNTAIKSIILHSPGDIYPGPFTYKRFWFRDAAFVLQAMTAVGLFKNIEKIIDRFPGRQLPNGYFLSQDGEWDSNGQAIWAVKRFIDTTNKSAKKEWSASIYRAAKWIEHKRITSDSDPLHQGLLPAGFSAEHFGPSDFYYWDDFWAVTGLRDAAALARAQDPAMANDFQEKADDLLRVINQSIAAAQGRLNHPGMPPSPTRRMDAGAIGCLVASYPLQIYGPRDERILQTTKFLMEKHFIHGAFYHELSHSGINIYLSLHIAQVLLRAGNIKFFDIVKSVADLATATGQWPEAIHPRTKGGCMGDGEHIWASAEWVMMVRNMFVREEQAERTVILCSGIPQEWLKVNETLFLGPTQTLWGEISVTVKVKEEEIDIKWQARWNDVPPHIDIRLPGFESHTVKGNTASFKIKTVEAAI